MQSIQTPTHPLLFASHSLLEAWVVIDFDYSVVMLFDVHLERQRIIFIFLFSSKLLQSSTSSPDWPRATFFAHRGKLCQVKVTSTKLNEASIAIPEILSVSAKIV